MKACWCGEEPATVLYEGELIGEDCFRSELLEDAWERIMAQEPPDEEVLTC